MRTFHAVLASAVVLALSAPMTGFATPGVAVEPAPPTAAAPTRDEPVPDLLIADGDPLRPTDAQVRAEVAPGEQVQIGVASGEQSAGEGPAGLTISTVTATGPEEAAAVIDRVAAAPEVLAVGLPQPVVTFGASAPAPLVLAGVGSDPLRADQYPLDMLCADETAVRSGPYTCATFAWQYANGSGQTVAVLDQGVATSHPDLAASIVGGAQCADTSTAGCIPVAQTASAELADHATHVAGSIGAVTNNGIGVSGMAAGAAIMPVQVIGASGSGSTTTLARGITWAVDNGATVLNMSLGTLGAPSDPVLEVAVANALYLGVPLVAAAGNDGPSANRVAYPAAYPGVIGVGNIDATRAISNNSTRGSWVDVVAPGTNVLSTIHTDLPGSGRYGWFSGTSMATPHVAATVAMLRQQQPHLTPAQLAELLTSTAADLGAPGRDDVFGHGAIQPVVALQRPPQAGPPAPVGAVFYPVAPARVLDTRADSAGPIPRRVARKVFVGQEAGTGMVVVPPGAVAVAYNLTIANPQASGHLRVMPGDTAFSTASAINVATGANIANGLVVALDNSRDIRVFNALPVPAHAVVDVLGFYLPAGQANPLTPAGSPTATGGRFTPIAPTRVFDSTGPAGRLAPGETRTIRVDQGTEGQADVIPVGSDAIAYNITVVEPGGGGHLRVMPGDVADTNSSAINWSNPADKIANGLVVKVAADRTIRVYNSAAVPVKVLIDVVGHYGATGALFYPISPARAYDSRQPAPEPGAMAAGAQRDVFVGDGRSEAGVVTQANAVPVGATAIAYNVTVPQYGPSPGGHMRLWPAQLAKPNASVINWPVGGANTRANGLVGGISADRGVRLYNGSSAPNHVIVDVLGYYR